MTDFIWGHNAKTFVLSEGRHCELRNKIQWSPTGKKQEGSMNHLQTLVWKPPFWLTDQRADWGYLGCKLQVYKFSWRTWLSCWQCNKTHTLCNSCSQERKNKKEQLESCAASACRAEEQQLSPGYTPVHPDSLSAHWEGSTSHGASPHQARRHSWQCRDRSPKNPLCSCSHTHVHVTGIDPSYWRLSVCNDWNILLLSSQHQYQILHCL